MTKSKLPSNALRRMVKKYRYHIHVNAAKIIAIEAVEPQESDESPIVYLLLHTGFKIGVSVDWCNRHTPCVGGYFIEYRNGYQSCSPAKKFEESYDITKNPAFADFREALEFADERGIVEIPCDAIRFYNEPNVKFYITDLATLLYWIHQAKYWFHFVFSPALLQEDVLRGYAGEINGTDVWIVNDGQIKVSKLFGVL